MVDIISGTGDYIYCDGSNSTFDFYDNDCSEVQETIPHMETIRKCKEKEEYELQIFILRSYWNIYKYIHNEMAKRITLRKLIEKRLRFSNDNIGINNFRKHT